MAEISIGGKTSRLQLVSSNPAVNGTTLEFATTNTPSGNLEVVPAIMQYAEDRANPVDIIMVGDADGNAVPAQRVWVGDADGVAQLIYTG